MIISTVSYLQRVDLQTSSVIFGSCSRAPRERYHTNWVRSTIISTLITINFTSQADHFSDLPVLPTFPVSTSRTEKLSFSIPVAPGAFHIHPPAEAQQAVPGAEADPGTACVCLSAPLFPSVSLSLLPALVKTAGGNLKIMVTIYNSRSIQRRLEAFLSTSRFWAEGK